MGVVVHGPEGLLSRPDWLTLTVDMFTARISTMMSPANTQSIAGRFR